jgi:hypothetical protein
MATVGQRVHQRQVQQLLILGLGGWQFVGHGAWRLEQAFDPSGLE